METSIDKERIERLQHRYRDEFPRISIERAKYYTESWKRTAGQPNAVRVSLAMKNVYENMTHHVDPDDRIAGYWTESFLGIPVDIERGVFNTVLATELEKSDILSFRVRSFTGMAAHLARTGRLRDAVSGIRSARGAGPQPMNLSLETMDERKINRFTITPADKKILLNQLLPYWRGRTVVDALEKQVNASGILGSDMKDFMRAFPANTSRQTMMLSTCATISTYQGHVILDYEKVVREGLLTMRDDIRARAAAAGVTQEQADYFQSVELAIEGVITFAQRLAGAVERARDAETDTRRRGELDAMLAACHHAPLLPARTFREAVQSAWTVKTAVELAHPVNLHCFGRMDQILISYYENDLAAGRITRGEAVELLAELLLKIMSQNIRPESNILSNFYHRYLGSSPVTIGGLRPGGSDGTNELTYVFLDAAALSGAVTNVSVRVHKDTPDALMHAVAGALQGGRANISLFNDDVNVEAMQRRGFDDPDARDYAVMGCVEMLCPGKTGGMSANALLLCRLLDITLRNGDSFTLMGPIRNIGLKTGGAETFETYEELEAAFMEQARHQIKMIAAASDLRDRLFAERLPAPLISAFIDGCADNARDVTAGGARYDLTGVSFINSIANLTDSLYVIKKLVFEEKAFTLKQLIEAVDHNYAGYEKILKRIQLLEGKWGNGRGETDELARSVSTKLFEETYKYTSPRGGAYVPYVISMTTHTIDGRVSMATPDGRRAATPYAASCNPYNVETNGVTGALRSVAALDFKHVLGCAVNMKFHPTAVGLEPEARQKWIALVRTYFALGGAQLQPTVASSETLRHARKHPEQYKDLIVKVGGYSAYFTELGREIQNEVIQRTEHQLT